MEVILLERVAKLGQMGEVVRVKDGFARNFLLPQGKALRATKENRTKFDGMKAQLEARNLEQKKDADVVAAKLSGKTFVVLRQASDVGQLFGSVSARDIADLVTKEGFTGWKPQHEVQLDDNQAFIDVAFPGEMLAVEYEGFEFHTTKKAWRKDRNIATPRAGTTPRRTPARASPRWPRTSGRWPVWSPRT